MIYPNYDALLEHASASAQSLRTLGVTVDGAPIVAARGGGDKLPAIFITAGSHSTEQAGVSAAVNLIANLDTEHEVHVIPTRDPIGLNGFAHALSLGLGEEPSFESFDEVEQILRREGTVLFEEEGMVLALVGDFGYVSRRPDGGCPQWAAYKRLQKLQAENPQVLAPLAGRRAYMTPGQTGVEGTGDFGRAYTLIFSPEGEVLHINRFHDTAWAPVEPRVTVQLMAQIRPGISFDLHESQLMEDRFWLSARHQADPQNQQWEARAATETIAAIAASGGTLAEDDDTHMPWFDQSEKAVFWLDANKRGEGLNLMDFASRHYGLAFGTEMGMYGSFEHRVALALTTVKTAVSVFEERYR
jgi:hypothetical protein